MNGLPLDSEYEKKEMMKDGQGHMNKNKFSSRLIIMSATTPHELVAHLFQYS